jgi:hypothetical protein
MTVTSDLMGVRDARLHTHLASILLAAFENDDESWVTFFSRWTWSKKSRRSGTWASNTHIHTFSNRVVRSRKDKMGQNVIWLYLIAENKIYFQIPKKLNFELESQLIHSRRGCLFSSKVIRHFLFCPSLLHRKYVIYWHYNLRTMNLHEDMPYCLANN